MLTHEITQLNRVLALLPGVELESVLARLQLVTVKPGTHLQRLGEAPAAVYFPVSGVASMISSNSKSQPVEVATIGNEGFVGLPLFLGGASSSLEVVMQVEGQVMKLAATEFRRLTATPAAAKVLLLYTQGLITQIAQTSVCNRFHTIEQRCARWLLQTHDRVNSNEFFLTQEFLGMMLSVRRGSVSAAASLLQNEHLISYTRGKVTILDRAGLESRACECYHIVTAEYERLVGWTCRHQETNTRQAASPRAARVESPRAQLKVD